MSLVVVLLLLVFGCSLGFRIGTSTFDHTPSTAYSSHRTKLARHTPCTAHSLRTPSSIRLQVVKSPDDEKSDILVLAESFVTGVGIFAGLSLLLFAASIGITSADRQSDRADRNSERVERRADLAAMAKDNKLSVEKMAADNKLSTEKMDGKYVITTTVAITSLLTALKAFQEKKNP